jgi:serine/threonine protein kinase
MRRPHLAPGSVVRDRYRVTACLGQGAVGVVYQARDLVAEQHVALKQLLVTTPQQRAGFDREAAILSELNHPALPRASAYFVDSGRPLLVMTLVPGPDLGQLLARRGKPFDLDSVLRWADELLEALAYLHARRIAHCDIKPHNVRLDADGRAMLVDFGLAQHLSALSDRGPCGYTAAYAPLEQFRGEPTDERGDLYALAATLYELLARRSPAPALSRAAAVLAGRPDPLLPLDTVNPSIPASLARTVRQALALHRAARPESAQAMQLALRSARRPHLSGSAARPPCCGASSTPRLKQAAAGGPGEANAVILCAPGWRDAALQETFVCPVVVRAHHSGTSSASTAWPLA